MAVGEGIISEIRETGEASLVCPRALQPGPGQYLLASCPDLFEAIAHPLFPASLTGDELALAPPLPAGWSVGTRLHLRGPLGRGFVLPHSARTVALAAYNGSPLPLIPLAQLAVRQNAAVTLFCASAPEDLPQAVEVLPLDLLSETLSWADTLAAVFPLSDLAAFRRLAGIKIHHRFPCTALALVLTGMPCAGLADCGVCAIPLPRGWKLACVDGPVFNLNELELL